MNDPATPTNPAADDALAGLDPQGLLRQGIDPAATSAPPAQRWQTPTLAELNALLPSLDVQELIGQGGMGAVYRAVQRHLDRTVALKVLPRELGADPDFAARFGREAKALARLNHPHLVTIHDYGQTNGWCWLLMEYVDGANLRQVMRTGRLSAQQALAIVPQLCDALQYAHDEGVVHRDIKPENILMDSRGRVKIADFGLAKLRAVDGSTGQALTNSGAVLGTVHYMAPEQVEGSKGVDHRADIYSLGVVFYEMLTGGLPLGRFDPPSRRVEVDVRLDEVVLKALEKDPDRRYQQAAQVQTAVEGAQAAATDPKQETTKSGIKVGKLEIDDKGLRFGDSFVVDEKGVRIAGVRVPGGKIQVLVDDEERGTTRNHFTVPALLLLGAGLISFFLAWFCFDRPQDVGPLWLQSAAFFTAPLLVFGGWCLMQRVSPTLSGLACFAIVVPAAWAWSWSWVAGVVAAVIACYPLMSVGGRRWDVHFTPPVPTVIRLLTVLTAIVVMLAYVFIIQGIDRRESFRRPEHPHAQAKVWSWTGPGKTMIERIDQSDRLPSTRVFQARPFVRWEDVEGVAAIEMWVELLDGSSFFTRRNLPPTPASGDPLTDPHWDAGNSQGWQEISLPFDARASLSPVVALRFDVLLPGKGRVDVRTPVLVADVEGAAVETLKDPPTAAAEVAPNPYRGRWTGRDDGEPVTIAVEGNGRLLINGSKAAAWSLDGGRLSVTDHTHGGAPISGFIDGQGRLVLVDELGKALVLQREAEAAGSSTRARPIPSP